MTYCSKLSPTASAHPADVVAAKLILRGLGHYEAPSWGISEYPDRDLFDAIKDFQAKQGLTVDGVINENGETLQALAQRLQALGRNGDTILAHINPTEAELLDRVTDGGSVNPLTGLLEYNWFSDALDAIGDFFGGTETSPSGSSSGNNLGSPDGGGDNDDNGPAQDDPDATPAVDSDPAGDDPEEETDSQTGGLSSSQKAGALQNEEEEKETLGDEAFEQKENNAKPAQPEAPKEEFSFWGNLAEDFRSIFSGTTKTGAKRGSKSAYDTRAAQAKAQEEATEKGLVIDWTSPEGKARVNSYQRGGAKGPGALSYDPRGLHAAQLSQLADEYARNSSPHGFGHGLSSNLTDHARSGDFDKYGYLHDSTVIGQSLPAMLGRSTPVEEEEKPEQAHDPDYVDLDDLIEAMAEARAADKPGVASEPGTLPADNIAPQASPIPGKGRGQMGRKHKTSSAPSYFYESLVSRAGQVGTHMAYGMRDFLGRPVSPQTYRNTINHYKNLVPSNKRNTFPVQAGAFLGDTLEFIGSPVHGPYSSTGKRSQRLAEQGASDRDRTRAALGEGLMSLTTVGLSSIGNYATKQFGSGYNLLESAVDYGWLAANGLMDHGLDLLAEKSDKDRLEDEEKD